MPVVVGLSSITGISTATSGSDAAYKEYIDNFSPKVQLLTCFFAQILLKYVLKNV